MDKAEGFCSKCGCVVNMEQKICPHCNDEFMGIVDLHEDFETLREISDASFSELDAFETEQARKIAVPIVNLGLALGAILILFGLFFCILH